ncbi:YczE/YyaS/YitT family protein [Ligilactobacillus equi]|uniref:Membrane protein n=1 Tax=Ligilactobacillus equi DPC 6820 TaxID=1392007 RepID=V7HVR1_9LACO|nr:membrane protein [Ligilactobacillus equi]ETA74329.1 membrane protein [Ligilactobacillus equi DPC 6820]
MSMKERFTIKRISIAMIGIFLVCIGVAFNNNTNLGNDPVGIIYDGIRASFGIPRINLGMVSNYINIGLLILLFIVGRHYASFGSFMYLIPYGFFVLLGSHLYLLLFPGEALMIRIVGGIVGISLYYIGISLFISADIGVDPFSGFMLTLRDYTKWSLRRTKITFDVVMICIGMLLGGRFGVITLITVCTTGPVIQYLGEKFKKIFRI